MLKYLVPRRRRLLLSYRPSAAIAARPGIAKGYDQDDRKIVERVIAAYQYAARDCLGSGNSMWQSFFEQRQQKLHQVFIGGQRGAATAVLRDPASSDLFYGFDDLCISYRKEKLSLKPKDEAARCLDGLICLDEAIGARRVDNPEIYIYRMALRPSVDPVEADSVVAEIEKVLGRPVCFPNLFRGEAGVLTARGIASFRVPPALYQAWRIKKLVEVASPGVLEIGAGLGRTAHYARDFGILDYTIIDIPFTSISQAYFLARVLGEKAVLLAGEDAPDAKTRIKILPPRCFLNGQGRYDLILNVDSFTEMDRGAAQTYWDQIESRANAFLSINHEANPFTVKEFVDRSQRVESYDRRPYWMRRGYVEELVRFRPLKT